MRGSVNGEGIIPSFGKNGRIGGVYHVTINCPGKQEHVQKRDKPVFDDGFGGRFKNETGRQKRGWGNYQNKIYEKGTGEKKRALPGGSSLGGDDARLMKTTCRKKKIDFRGTAFLKGSWIPDGEPTELGSRNK